MATMVTLGPTGLAVASELLRDTPASRLSNCQGEGTAPVGGGPPGDEVTVKPRDNIGVPAPPPRAERKKAEFVPNVLRLWVENVYGHHYGYFDVLAASGLDERHVLRAGQQVKIPARGNRRLIFEAAKWRKRFGGRS
jgi:hypothetical protein